MVLSILFQLHITLRSNGQAENSVKYAKTKLKCAFRYNVKDLSVSLIEYCLIIVIMCILLCTNETPAKLMFNRPLRTRFDLLKPNRSRVLEAKTGITESVANGRKTRVFYVN